MKPEVLRRDVRAFLADRPWDDAEERFPGFNPAFSEHLGAKGWIGPHWPAATGAKGWCAATRYVLQEEMLAAGAPILAHTVGERQTGPLLLRFGTDAQRKRFLPQILAGRAPFCIGMSEPSAGSDLAGLQMKATPADGGYRVTGSKLWTSLAHLSQFIVVLCRTSRSGDKHEGISHLIIDLASSGITIAPIRNLLGEHEFNQVFFDDVLVGDEALVGREGAGWAQAMSELAFERGGPDRFMSSYGVFVRLIDALGADPSEMEAQAVGQLAAHLSILRELARDVAQDLAEGRDANLRAAIVKELGATFEQDLAERMRALFAPDDVRLSPDLRLALDTLIQRAPTFSIRGGTREVLRGVIAKAALKGT